MYEESIKKTNMYMYKHYCDQNIFKFFKMVKKSPLLNFEKIKLIYFDT